MLIHTDSLIIMLIGHTALILYYYQQLYVNLKANTYVEILHSLNSMVISLKIVLIFKKFIYSYRPVNSECLAFKILLIFSMFESKIYALYILCKTGSG